MAHSAAQEGVSIPGCDVEPGAGQAAERVDQFTRRWEARMGFGAQTGDAIYSVTVHGFDGEAELLASDLRALLADRQRWIDAAAGMGHREARALAKQGFVRPA